MFEVQGFLTHKKTPPPQWCDGFGMYGCPGNEIRFYVNKWDKQFVTARYFPFDVLFFLITLQPRVE